MLPSNHDDTVFDVIVVLQYTDCCDEYMRSATCLMIALLLCGK